MDRLTCAWPKSWPKYLLSGLAFLVALPSARAQNAAQAVPVQSRIVSAVDDSILVTLPGNTHPLARAQYDQGAVADSQPLHRIQLLLQRSPNQEASHRSLLDRQQSQSTPDYHQWLTPQQFGQLFGPSDADIQTVTGWLASQGFQVDHVSAGKTVIEFSGSAGQLRNAFHTEIHKYLVSGQEHLANSGDPQIPAALAPVVAGTVALHNFGRKALHKVGGLVTSQKQTSGANPSLTLTCQNNSGASFTCYVVDPADFATIYNSQNLWNSGIDGGGQTIAIVGDSNINCADVINFRGLFNLPVNTTAENCTQPTSNVQIILNGPDPGLNPDEIEADLDVEWSGAVARGAHIDFVTSEQTEVSEGVDLSAEYIVDNNLAPVMSESFGECEGALGTAGNLYYSGLWEQAAAQGITAIVSSGDSGAAGCDDDDTESVSSFGLAVNGIGSTPFNVSAGGTDFNDFSNQSTYWSSSNSPLTMQSVLSYIPEIPWDDSCAADSATGCNGLSIAAAPANLNIVGGSGGESNCASINSHNECLAGYAKPSWQEGLAVTRLAQTDGLRDLPDISLFAAAGSSSNSFYPICATDLGGLCFNGSFIGVGGTSSAAPAFAGIMAMTNQYMATQSLPSRQGNANYVLYSLASNQVAAATSCTSTSTPDTANGGCTFYDVVLDSHSVPCVTGYGCTIQNAKSNTAGELEEVNNSGNPDGTLAWQAGPGYDMATGLGSVNAYNLVHNWPGVVGTFKATTSSLQLCAGTPQVCVTSGSASTLSLTHGAAVTVSAGVSPTPPNTGTPTGDVALLATPDTLSNNDGSSSAGVDYFAGNSETGVVNMGAYSLTNGAASGSTKYLVGGNYAATTRYSGDGTFGASSSGSVNVSVTPESSVTTVGTLVADPNTGNFVNSSPYGFLDFVRVDVVGASGDETASGNVTVTDSGTAIGGSGCCMLNSEGNLEIQAGVNLIPTFSVGAHSFQAAYAGDSSYQPSASGAVSFAITQAVTTTSVTSSQNSVTAGTPVTLTAAIATDSIGAAPSGTVTFFANGAPISASVTYTRTSGSLLGTPKTGGNLASLTATASYTPTSTTTITAMYNADANYASSPLSAGVLINVSQNTFSISSPNFSSSDPVNIATPGQTGSASITVGSTNGFTGMVTLTCSVSPTNLTAPPHCVFPQTSSTTAAVNLTSTATSVPVALSVTTTANSMVPPPAARPNRNLPIGAPALWMYGSIGLAMLFVLQAFRLQKRRAYAWFAFLVLVTIATAVSCSGGGSGSTSATPSVGTTAATYMITITATAAGLPVQTDAIVVNVQ